MEEFSRDFKGIWIPREIWLNPELNAIEKALLAEINSLDGKKGCFASNEYLARFCGISVRQTIRHISKLREMGFINLKSFDGRTRVLKTNLGISIDKNVMSDM